MNGEARVGGRVPWYVAAGTSARPPREVPVVVDPLGNLCGVEADEVPPFDEGDPSFGDESSDVADVDAQVLGEAGDVEQAAGVERSWSCCSSSVR